MIRLFNLLLSVILILPALSQKLIAISPTDSTINNLPVMELFSDTSKTHQAIQKLQNETIIGDFVELNGWLQTYLKKNNKKSTVKDSFIGLTKNQGGFARKGFYLQTDSGLVDFSNTYYVDVVENTISSPQDKLMSLTQLFPHELGHAMYRSAASSNDSLTNSYSSHIHYFSLLTDPAIAFNEGFAEHIENIARLFEANDSIKNGIEKSTQQIGQKWKFAHSGFRNDMKFLLRLGFYRSTMIVWYQQFEDWKRYRHSVDGEIMFEPERLETGTLEDQITFLNTSAFLDNNKLRNYASIFISEGMVSRFFTLLTTCKLSIKYLEPGFYHQFGIDTTLNPVNTVSPFQNQFLKYFRVFHQYLDVNFSQSYQLSDFIEGYIEMYPGEKDILLKTFEKATGHPYTQPPPLIWMMAKEHSHRLLLLDAYNALTLPFYTFTLNTATEVDLQTLGISEVESNLIVQHRDQNGYFETVSDLKGIKGLSETSKDKLLNAELDVELYESIGDPDLNIKDLLKAPIKNILIKSLIISLIGFVCYLYLTKNRGSILKQILTFLGKWLILFIIILVLLFSLVVGINPLIPALGISVSVFVILFVTYKRKTNLLIPNFAYFGITLIYLIISTI